MHGLATIGAHWIRMKVPKNHPWTVKRFAQVLVHEIGHTQGLQHDDQAPWWEFEVPWVEGLPMREKAAPAPKHFVDARAEKAQAALAKWQDELQRRQRAVKVAKRKVQEYERKVRYYEQRGPGKAPAKRETKFDRLVAAYAEHGWKFTRRSFWGYLYHAAWTAPESTPQRWVGLSESFDTLQDAEAYLEGIPEKMQKYKAQ